MIVKKPAPMALSHVPKSATLAERLTRSFVVEAKTGCWLWTRAKHRRGHGRLYWRGTMQAAHRLAYVAAHGAIPPKKWVWHRCNEPSCVNPKHLRLGSNKDLVAQRVLHRLRRGERCGTAKLTELQARAIRRDKRVQRVIATEYGVSRSLVSAIKVGRTWNHF